MTDGVNSSAPNISGQPQAPAPSDKKTVLLIEDDPFLVKMYKEKFEVEGLRLATGQNVDIIILDILIPKLSGIDLLTRLRKDPKGVSIPVIVLTNLTQKEDEVKTASMGVKEYLVKSDYTPSQVVEKVRVYLGQPHT
jgi:DNA-binding response OmpR family regulator